MKRSDMFLSICRKSGLSEVMKGWHIMQTRKEILILTFILLLSFVLAGCGGNEVSSSLDRMESSEETEIAEKEAEDTFENNRDILITYFSHTGNTEKVAQMIAEFTGGDLAEIKRAEEYGDLQEEAKVEIQNGIHPEIAISVSNMEEYDVIFVGYPIWWNEAPAMIATFLAENDFSGKEIVPFCTSASDDIGNSLHIFNELCADAEIAEGLTANNLDDIEPWLSELGLIQ